MSKAYEFLKECGYFYVLTINGEYPAGRPFGAVMEVDDDLYFATHDGNKAHEQLRNNEHIQILAKKEGIREWIRITGLVKESDSIELKQRMMEECPILKTHYSSADSKHYLLFQVKVQEVEFK